MDMETSYEKSSLNDFIQDYPAIYETDAGNGMVMMTECRQVTMFAISSSVANN